MGTLLAMWTNKQAAYERVTHEPIAWLTTVSAAGVPSTAPIWFRLEEDGTILIYSKNPSVRVRNLQDNDKATLHLEGNGTGGAIVVMNGSAIIDDGTRPAHEHTAFIAKYQSFLDAYGWSAESFSRDYPTPIRMTVTSVRGT
jgi:PPOX class probable F420-dependent enzyme